ncbi:MAG: nuclear transport factor 2 family protein [Rhodococcus sp. (in: high G+C Gram-positive bacteria)]
MALSSDEIRNTVQRYLDMVATGTADQIMAMYAETAVLEDPVGSEPRSTAESIREFYAMIEPLQSSTTLQTMRVSGQAAAFHFEVRTVVGDTEITVSAIETMEFDDAGLITSMRAFWSQDDMTTAPVA